MSNFYSFFYQYLQKKKLKDPGLSSDEKYELCMYSNNLGNSSVARLSANQASFRRDLQLVCEAAGIGGSQFFVSDDCKFIDIVIVSSTVRRIFKKCARDTLGVAPFGLHVKAIGDVVDFK